MQRNYANEAKVWKVSEITGEIIGLLERSYPSVAVEGEISNMRTSAQGHLYFSLKDEGAVLNAVLFGAKWKLDNAEFQDGSAVVVYGRISGYAQQGKYQLIAERITNIGEGALEIAFRKLKEKLEKEGLFDPSLKRRLPAMPQKVGVITSGSGAALRDILRTIHKQCPSQKIVLSPALVQGAQAAADIIRALKSVVKIGGVDVVIIARGGGSLEDLWAFNDEALARAIRASPVPVISGVGHETDFTICDFASDYRAATPTAAAHVAVPDANLQKEKIAGLVSELTHAIQEGIRSVRYRLTELSLSPHLLISKIDQARLSIGASEARMKDAFINIERELLSRLNPLRRRLLLAHPRRRLIINERKLVELVVRLKDNFFEKHFRVNKYRYSLLHERLVASAPKPVIAGGKKQVEALKKSINRAIGVKLGKEVSALANLAVRLEQTNPENILKRGFAIALRDSNGVIIRAPHNAPVGESFTLRLAEGAIKAKSEGEKKN